MKIESGTNVMRNMFRRSVQYNLASCFIMRMNTVVDGVITSHYLGSKATAAFGLIVPFYSLLSVILVLFGTALQMEMSRLLGKGETEKANRFLTFMIVLSVISVIPLVLLITVGQDFTIHILTVGKNYSPEVELMVTVYLTWFAPGLLPYILNTILHPLMQLDGDGKRSVMATTIACAVNVIGDILVVTVIGGGMAGISIASTLSLGAECLVLLTHFPSKRGVVHPVCGFQRIEEVGGVLYRGVPRALSEITTFFTGIMINRFIVEIAGETAVAVRGVGNSLWMLLLPFSSAVASALLSLGGIARGEEDRYGVNAVLKLAIWYSLVPWMIIAIVFALLSGPIAAYCSQDATVQAMAQTYLICLGFSLPFATFARVNENFFNVIERRNIAIALNLTEGAFSVLIATVILGRLAGVNGLWFGRLAGSAFQALCFAGMYLCLYFRRKEGVPLSDPLIPKKFGAPDTDCLERTVHSVDETIAFSGEVQEFCKVRNLPGKVCMLSALSIEEIVCNVFQHGYENQKNQYADLRVVCKEGILTLRVRDFGKPFNPKKYAEQFHVNQEDPSKHIGLRMLTALVKDMRYVNIVDANVLIIKI